MLQMSRVARTMTRTVAEKMGIRAGLRSYFAHASPGILASMNLPTLVIAERLQGEFDYIHLFVETQEAMEQQFPVMRDHLAADGMLWVSWPKAHQLGSDLSLPIIIGIGYSHGLVESTTVSINDVWSAIKFTHPKSGKIYQNSYGTLPPNT